LSFVSLKKKYSQLMTIEEQLNVAI
jgi:hypothetical protein